mmetsp:Transcript_136381/g.265300  ORF Transcript_136381/g.265300 Transcript_136381/m.265300 type:complete len:203 (+) Transcript_136381:58-666(+)
MANFQPVANEMQPVALAEYLDSLSTINDIVDEESVQMLSGKAQTKRCSHWRTLAVTTMAVAAMIGVALLVVVQAHGLGRPQARTPATASAIEDLFSTSVDEVKFYDAHGIYWRAPHRGVASPECRFAHAYVCGSLCCCDEDHYWNSPKMMTGQVAHEDHYWDSPKMVTGQANKQNFDHNEQLCTSKEQVPSDVLSALDSQME